MRCPSRTQGLLPVLLLCCCCLLAQPLPSLCWVPEGLHLTRHPLQPAPCSEPPRPPRLSLPARLRGLPLACLGERLLSVLLL